MKKKMLRSGSAVLTFIALALLLTACTPEEIPEDDVRLMNLTRLPVQFSHTAMQAVECNACHHLVDGQENRQRCSTSGCHDILGSNAKREVHSYYRIAHETATEEYYTCMKCHLEIAAQKPELKQALTGCSASRCHPQ